MGGHNCAFSRLPVNKGLRRYVVCYYCLILPHRCVRHMALPAGQDLRFDVRCAVMMTPGRTEGSHTVR